MRGLLGEDSPERSEPFIPGRAERLTMLATPNMSSVQQNPLAISSKGIALSVAGAYSMIAIDRSTTASALSISPSDSFISPMNS